MKWGLYFHRSHIANDDILQLEFCFVSDYYLIDVNLGQVYTKREVADFMVNLFTLQGKARVLDPCFGHGVFVRSLLEKTNYFVEGIEIDKRSFSLFENPDNERCSLKLGDFFDIKDDYDGIIMNPPYVRQEEIKDLKPLGISKQKLQTSCALMTISSKANLYMYFILRAIILLHNDGELIAIVPISWTNTPVGKQFYEQICHFGFVSTFIDVRGDAFEGDPMVDVCILKFIRGGSGKTTYKQLIINQPSGLTINTIAKQGFNGTTELIKLQSIAKIRRGITTGFNRMFINPPLLSHDHQVQILSSPKDIIGYSTHLCKQNTLLAIKKGDTLNEEEVLYLDNCADIILKEGKPQTLKSLIEKGFPWYYLSIQEKAQIIFAYIVRSNFKFVLNEEECYVRDNFYTISTVFPPLLILALLNNYHIFNQLERSGKRYGNGVLKIQRYDIDNLRLPHPSVITEDDRNKLICLSKNLVKRAMESDIDTITELLAPYYGEKDAKNTFINLKSKRLAKYE